jgi:hypothetical protein
MCRFKDTTKRIRYTLVSDRDGIKWCWSLRARREIRKAEAEPGEEREKSWMGSSWGQKAAGLMMQFLEPQRADVTRAGIRYMNSMH